MKQEKEKRGVGRPKNSKNFTTRGVRNNILDVFERIGGVKNFAAWAQDNQTEFYKHYVKLLPQNFKLSGDSENPIVTKIQIEFIDHHKNERVIDSTSTPSIESKADMLTYEVQRTIRREGER